MSQELLQTRTHLPLILEQCKSFDSDTNVLETTFENVIRVEQEQDGTFNEGIELEDGTVIGDNTITEGIELEQEQDFETEEGDNIILDGTEIATPPKIHLPYCKGY